MGFFSFDCKGCGASVKSDHAVKNVSERWQTEVVATGAAEGLILKGTYDGYGTIVADLDEEDPSLAPIADLIHVYDVAPCVSIPFTDDHEGTPWAVWHERCWEEAGSPTNSEGGSPCSEDQGFFY